MNFSTQSGRSARAFPVVAWIVALLWWGLLWPGSAAAQPAPPDARDEADRYPPVYRVELIVFRHADGRSDRRRSPAPADFTERLDPLLVAAANEAAQRQLVALARFLPVAEVPGRPDEATPFLESGEQILRPIPPLYSALGDLSPSMQRAMSRLIDAPAFEPVTTRAWLQLAPPQARTAAVRVHDRAVVETLEPETVPDVALPRVLPFGPLIETPPPARAIYRLDGTVRLRQRRFLHLELDLVWQRRSRTPAGPEGESGVAAEPGRGPDAEAPASGPAAGQDWERHRVRQSRVVRPGRLEYFDSSLFGILVRIERFKRVVPKVQGDPAEQSGESPGDSAAPRRPATETGA